MRCLVTRPGNRRSSLAEPRSRVTREWYMSLRELQLNGSPLHAGLVLELMQMLVRRVIDHLG